MSKICGVYLLTHTETGMKYVGQSINILNRWRIHSKGLCTKRLGRTIAHYGWAAFSAEIIEECPRDQLNDVEIKWVKHHDCISPKGLNLTSGGCANHFVSAETSLKHSINGFNLSQEARAKISAAHKGRIVSDETRRKQSEYRTGKLLSEETKAKLKILGTGRIQSPETKAKRSISCTVSNQKPEVKAKISAALTGIKRSSETRAKISAARTGKKHSPETIAKRIAAQFRFKKSPEAIAKTAAAHIGVKHTPERRANITAVKAANKLLRNYAAGSAACCGRAE